MSSDKKNQCGQLITSGKFKSKICIRKCAKGKDRCEGHCRKTTYNPSRKTLPRSSTRTVNPSINEEKFSVKEASSTTVVDNCLLSFTWQVEVWKQLISKEWDYTRLKWIVGAGGDEKTSFCRSFAKHFPHTIVLTAFPESFDIMDYIQAHSSTKYILVDLRQSRFSNNDERWHTIVKLVDYIKYTKQVKLIFFSIWQPQSHCNNGETIIELIPAYIWEYGIITNTVNSIDKLGDKVISWQSNPSRLLLFEHIRERFPLPKED